MVLTTEKILFAIGCMVYMVLVDLEKYKKAKAENPTEPFDWALAGIRWGKGLLFGLGVGEGLDAAGDVLAISTVG